MFVIPSAAQMCLFRK